MCGPDCLMGTGKPTEREIDILMSPAKEIKHLGGIVDVTQPRYNNHIVGLT